MPSEYQYDVPVSRRPEPPKEILVRAQRHMLDHETDLQAYVRQHWETAFSALRVAMDAWRTIVPLELDSFTAQGRDEAERAIGKIISAYMALDLLSEEVLGPVMYQAQRGNLTLESLDDLEQR